MGQVTQFLSNDDPEQVTVDPAVGPDGVHTYVESADAGAPETKIELEERSAAETALTRPNPLPVFPEIMSATPPLIPASHIEYDSAPIQAFAQLVFQYGISRSYVSPQLGEGVRTTAELRIFEPKKLSRITNI
jgi:hypothetical protein